MLFKALMESKWTTCFFTHIWFLALNISNYLHGIPVSNFPAFYEHNRSGQAYQLELQTPLPSHSILSRLPPHRHRHPTSPIREFYCPLQTFVGVSKAFLVFFRHIFTHTHLWPDFSLTVSSKGLWHKSIGTSNHRMYPWFGPWGIRCRINDGLPQR